MEYTKRGAIGAQAVIINNIDCFPLVATKTLWRPHDRTVRRKEVPRLL